MSPLCAALVFTLALMALRRRRWDSIVPLVVMVAVPPFLIWVISHGHVSYMRYQFILFTLPFWAALAGVGLTHVYRSRRSLFAAMCLLVFLTLSAQNEIYDHWGHQKGAEDSPIPSDYAGAALAVSGSYSPGDAVVFDRTGVIRIDAGVKYHLPRDVALRDVFAMPHIPGNEWIDPTDYPFPARCLREQERRIWVVTQGNDVDPLAGLAPRQARALRAEYQLITKKYLSNLTVTLLQRSVSAASASQR